MPQWIVDAIWIEAALQSPPADTEPAIAVGQQGEPYAFEHLLTPVVEQADVLLFSSVGVRALDHLANSARTDLRQGLLEELSGLFATALYEMFGASPQRRRHAGRRSLATTGPLDADLAVIRRDLLFSNARGRVAAIEGGLSDPHNNGRSVLIVRFDDGADRLQAQGPAPRQRLARTNPATEPRHRAHRGSRPSQRFRWRGAACPQDRSFQGSRRIGCDPR